MPTWKKVIVSGSQAHLQGITASNLTNNTSTGTAQIVGYNPTTGIFSYFNTSSIAQPNSISGSGVANRLTMWSGGNTITTASIYASVEANPRYLIGYTDTAFSPTPFTGRLNVSGSGANEGIVVGSRVSSDLNSYATYVFSDTEGPKIGFGSYTVAAATTPLSASWAQIGAYNQALRFEAFTTGSHVLSGGILFSYSGSNRPDLKISASNGATLVGINTNTPTNTLQVNGGVTATSFTGSLLGTASVAVNAQTASFLPVGTYSITSSWATNALTASFLPIGTYSITSSWATNALTASNITPAITNNIDNRVLTATGGGTINGETNLTFDGTTFAVGSTGFTATTTGDVNVGGNATITGNLTVNGDTTIINTSTISIEDKFIILGRSSGSQAPASEGGIIVEGAAGSGSAFVFNSGSAGGNGLSNRWGVALGVPTGSSDITPTDFMVTVSGSAANPIDTSAPTFGSSSFGFGNMHINTSTGEIWIWS